jgi:hypothetical protein
MREVGVTTSKNKSGSYRIFFDKKDVQKACRMMVCGENHETCMRLMEESAITCELCYSVLIALRKRPATIKPVLN